MPAAAVPEVLTDERTDEYTAMLHVYEGGVITTSQQKGHAETLKESGRLAFFDRMQRLKTEPASSAAQSGTTASATQPDLGTKRAKKLLV
ncbi:MAG TPA: hypothetical protein VH120_05295, partial [Gemmataceae bacterium]|nr:hypothetical protein [Gemmataceae bacterium]